METIPQGSHPVSLNHLTIPLPSYPPPLNPGPPGFISVGIRIEQRMFILVYNKIYIIEGEDGGVSYLPTPTLSHFRLNPVFIILVTRGGGTLPFLA